MTLATSEQIVALLNRSAEHPIRQATLRQWVWRGKLTIRGRENGLNLYDVDDVIRLVKARDAWIRDHRRVRV